MLLANRFTLNPVLVIVSLFFWHFIWGIPGAFLAVPLLDHGEDRSTASTHYGRWGILWGREPHIPPTFSKRGLSATASEE